MNKLPQKSTMIKLSFALSIICFYTYVFGIMDTVGNEFVTDDVNETNSAQGNADNTDALGDIPPIDTYTRTPDVADYDPPPVIYNERDSINDDEPTEDTEDETDDTPRHETSLPPETPPITATTAPPNNNANNPPTNTQPPPNTPTTATPTPPTPPNNGSVPKTITILSGGNVITGDTLDIVTRVVEAEIGSSFHEEAIKAQVVAVYTYIRKHNESGSNPVLPIKDQASDKVKQCATAVWGQAIYHNDVLINAAFSASSAGYTSSARNVWGSDIAYLQSIKTAFDEQYDPRWQKSQTFSSKEIADNVKRETGITLSGEPETWLKINGRVDTVYVGEMSIGGQTTYKRDGEVVPITGRAFRERIMGFDLRSASFTFTYNRNDESFTFVTNGYGHGVGLSQNGANTLAKQKGFSYRDILLFYYTGVTVK